MNFYSFNLGDYASATRHLTWDEDIAYRRLLDAYYQREGPLPAAKAEVCRLINCRTKKQKAAVEAVLSEFFEITPDGYRHHRCEEEIFAAKQKRKVFSQNATNRWKAEKLRKIKDGEMQTHCNGNATAMQRQCSQSQSQSQSHKYR